MTNRWAKPYHVLQEERAARRSIIDQRLRETWHDVNVTWRDLTRELGLKEETLRRYGVQLGLGPRPIRPKASAHIPVPPKPSGKGAKYAGRRYEDDPRDAPSTVPARMQAPMVESITGCSAAMCAL